MVRGIGTKVIVQPWNLKESSRYPESMSILSHSYFKERSVFYQGNFFPSPLGMFQFQMAWDVIIEKEHAPGESRLQQSSKSKSLANQTPHGRVHFK